VGPTSSERQVESDPALVPPHPGVPTVLPTNNPGLSRTPMEKFSRTRSEPASV